ncbi:MAG: leucine-rich repeat domain-containing protein [Clostridiales bacterium]|nr:leucine-rich repeat domain-containing protein [Clostridiales bacterium]
MKKILMLMLAVLIVSITACGAVENSIVPGNVESVDYDSVTELTIAGNCFTAKSLECVPFNTDGYYWKDELRGWDEQFGNMPDELAKCTNLTKLSIFYNSELDNIDFVATMPELRSLEIYMGAFDDLSPLKNCTKLEKLTIYGVENLSDISPLANLTNLKHLEISGCSIEKMWCVAALHELERLYIRYNRCDIVDQDVLGAVGSLRSLVLICPNIDISALNNSGIKLEFLRVGGENLIYLR